MLRILAVLAVFLVGCASPVDAAPASNVSYDVGVCDPSYPQRCIKPNVDGSITVSGGGISAVAAAVAPTYTPGTNPLSMDLSAGLRQRVEDGQDVSQGAKADTACASDSGACSQIALLKRQLAAFTTAFGSGSPVPTFPYGYTTTDASTTTSGTTNTFTTAIAANPSRAGCSIQNPITATTTLFVFEGASTTAATTKSVNLAPGAIFNCGSGGTVLTGQIQVASVTLSAPYIAKYW